jgi:hypothetical protein
MKVAIVFVAVAASRLIEASCFARPIPNRQRCSMPTSLKILSSAVMFRSSIDAESFSGAFRSAILARSGGPIGYSYR